MELRSSGRPYASVHVAVFEPLILEWVGQRSLRALLEALARRPTRKRLAPHVATVMSPPLGLSLVGGPARIAGVVPLVIKATAGEVVVDQAEVEARRRLVDGLLADARPDLEAMRSALEDAGIPPLASDDELRHLLSPVGVMHRFRQLYFDAGAGVGPIEHAFGIAPNEELVVVQETSRREATETTEQFGTEATQDKAAEQVTVEEISDHVQTSFARDMQVAVSASAGGSIGIFGGSASTSAALAQSTERARELATLRSTTQTYRSSETIRKTYTLSVRSSTEITERSSTRRTVRNDADAPVNYGLRRVLRSVKVKLQSLGPQLVWQTYVASPGARLGGGKFVRYHETTLVGAAVPGAPTRPDGGAEAGSQTVAVETAAAAVQTAAAVGYTLGTGHRAIRISVADDPDRVYTSLIVDSIDDATGSDTPAVVGLLGATHENGATVFAMEIDHDGASAVIVSFTAHHQPSEAALARWREQVSAAQQQYDAARAQEEFARAERTIVARSKIRPRPAADLRDEERYELLGRLIEETFAGTGPAALPGPPEVELFHRYLDVSGIFYFVHPAWWRPRYGAARRDYEITEDSEPARFGASLGWMLQLDGDRRRNELLNSPWVRLGVPIRPGVEREALAWLAAHFEGRRGFDLEGTTGTLLSDVEARRAQERLALPGPDYVTVSGEVAPSREQAAGAYPVIDELDLGMPTEGFVYERLEIAG